ncbi:lipopolysaccharide-induced tumor necrosis factor-alpha factor [Parambassis ranga]|uniref:Lipopolysaccharide-induced tumor necrosis factor-alpha factor-like n=1 Tax=Parambassis ranga TaxID=210632 RepID=A0A6P7IUX3_9TELE|nr:lipopolysaccharide-induced tumor necrosis factor-alpha factor-like [Parambassis ranga]XP_028265191.1 lipopolysaccharide-induced tumor necrosis factor-alpha factor-like [Parambassis ranga]XP_028265199.1 lipopolysaccharide-induced tumor necrosis factor-alpha factor-like [Parambassis ranga]
MEPPSYEEASRQPSAQDRQAFNFSPPPAYNTSLPTPPTPPPSYGEAVTTQPDPFPILTPPSGSAAVTAPPRNTRTTIHPLTQIGVRQPISSRHAQTAVVTQPQPVPISVACLRDSPGLVCCPHCHHIVTSKVIYTPGKAAWCMCILLTLMGLICGFCLIPLMVRGLQDAHHSCPQCGKPLHVYQR